jgi:hypothetical protein
MKIKLKTLKQENFEIELEDITITIDIFKKVIEEKLNIDSKKVKLLYNGKVLENTQMMSETGINEEVALVMMNVHKSTAEVIQEEEKICQADIKVEEVPQVVGSIMKVMCKKNPEMSQKYFEELKADNPAIMNVLKKDEAKFKKILYSPINSVDNKIFRKFYNGEDMKTYLEGLDDVQIEVNPDIENLIANGYTRQQAEEAYFVCDKNFDLALNYLLDNN